MTFGERMNRLIDQGAQAAAKAGEKAQDWGEKGYQVSKDWLNKAGAKAQELGEIGMLKLEIHQLESQAQRLITRLGFETYQALSRPETGGVTADSPALKPILEEITRIREQVEKREAELAGRK